MKRQGVWQKVVKVDTEQENHCGKQSWWMVLVHTVHLECGHKKVYRNTNTHASNQKRALCKECPHG